METFYREDKGRGLIKENMRSMPTILISGFFDPRPKQFRVQHQKAGRGKNDLRLATGLLAVVDDIPSHSLQSVHNDSALLLMYHNTCTIPWSWGLNHFLVLFRLKKSTMNRWLNAHTWHPPATTYISPLDWTIFGGISSHASKTKKGSPGCLDLILFICHTTKYVKTTTRSRYDTGVAKREEWSF